MSSPAIRPQVNFHCRFSLLAVTVVTAFCADYLVASIEETANRYSIPKAFIGLILLPIVVCDYISFPCKGAYRTKTGKRG